MNQADDPYIWIGPACTFDAVELIWSMTDHLARTENINLSVLYDLHLSGDDGYDLPEIVAFSVKIKGTVPMFITSPFPTA